ncbi:MAG: cupin domain-containing protein [Anaerolineae bacterium]|nr:cupin domain-containing protein [Anaerolineae bacterium]
MVLWEAAHTEKYSHAQRWQNHLIEQVAPPNGESPYHIHDAEDEIFHILEGEMSFVSGDMTWKGGPGTFIFLPRGIPHGFRVEGTQPARGLLITTSGGFEQFVRELGQPMTELVLPAPGPIDMNAVMAAAGRNQIQILGPLPNYTI